jgi:hypothetical protein
MHQSNTIAINSIMIRKHKIKRSTTITRNKRTKMKMNEQQRTTKEL